MTDNKDKFIRLRRTYQEFIFKGFDYVLKDNELSVVYNFYADDKFEFHPTLRFKDSGFYHFEKLGEDVLRNFLFNIGMVELISYWKAMVPPQVVVYDYELDERQKAFWKKVYYHGLGEYFYLNGIDVSYDEFLNIQSRGERQMQPAGLELNSGVIIPVGGGKDSVVTLELLKNTGGDNLALIMNPRGASSSTAAVAGFEEKTLVIERRLDKRLLELNGQGFLNGHTPFSALLAFVTVLAAAGSGRKYIALSNEGSANEPTVAGTKINHQYSKSFEFESDFRDYVATNLSGDISYFSMLRPLSEFQIASLFARSPQYFSAFRSCNAGSKTDSWCGKCPKCLFTFIILSPFVSPGKLTEIFGTNLLDDNELEGYFDELTGLSEVKPFECIGTVDEVNAALCLTRSRYSTLPRLLQRHKEKFGDDFCKKVNKKQLLTKVSEEHFLEPQFLDILKQALKEDNE